MLHPRAGAPALTSSAAVDPTLSSSVVANPASSSSVAADPAPSSLAVADPAPSSFPTALGRRLEPGRRIDGGGARPRSVQPRSRPVWVFSFFVYFNRFTEEGKATASINHTSRETTLIHFEIWLYKIFEHYKRVEYVYNVRTL